MLKRAFTVLAVAALVLAAMVPVQSASAGTWKWCSSNDEGTWRPHGGSYLVQNDNWAPGGPQTICADSAGDWQVTSTQPDEGGQVLTYPDTGVLYGTDAGQAADPVSTYRLIRNTFTESMPTDAGESLEAADDVWLNHWNIEVMVWVDNNGRSLDGGTELAADVPIFGQHFSVWKYGGSEFIFDLDHNETTGTTHILASIRWLMAGGYVPADATLTEAEFGFEFAYTNGTQQAAVTSYKMLTALRS